jgi:kynureninase
VVTVDRTAALAADAADPLRSFRDEFVIADDGVVYLDGNSLGRLPKATIAAVDDALTRAWGEGLVASWEEWIDLPVALGDALGPLIGAAPGETILSDQTSADLYKLAAAAVSGERPDIVSDDGNFPSDLYVLAGVAESHGGRLRVVETDPVRGITAAQVAAACDERVGAVSHSHVGFRSGAIAPMDDITAAAHDAGALALWDLSHSVGVVPVDLGGAGADLAVGCTYKYLNGGPGAPALLFVREGLHGSLRQPIQGWWGHRDMFSFAAAYEPATDVRRFAVGTPPILSLVGIQVGIDLTRRAGMERIRAKSTSLTSLLLELADGYLPDLGFGVASPREAERRGGHVALRHREAYRISQALRLHGVVVDFREPDTIRLGPAPLYTTHAEVCEAVDRLVSIVASGAYRRLPPGRAAVT